MANEPITATAGGRQVTCTHCGGGWFWPRKVVMSSGTATFFGVDAFSPEATMLSCAGCGKIEMFQPAAVQVHHQPG